MDNYTEYEKIRVRVTKAQLEEIVKQSEDPDDNVCEIYPNKSYKVSATIHFSYEFNKNTDITFDGDEAIVEVECKGNIEIADETLEAIFLNKKGNYEKIEEE